MGYLITSDHQLYNVTPLKTPVRLLISLLQSQPHVTTITVISLRCVTFTQLTIIHVRDYRHLLHSYTFTLAEFSAINYYLKLSHTLHLYTSRVCLLSRPHSYSWLLKNCSREMLLNNWLLRHSSSSYITLNRTGVTAATSQMRDVTSLADTRRSRDTPLLLLPGDVTAACCVGTVFQYCCVMSSRLRGNLVYRLVPGNGLRNLCCVTQQWVDMSQYFVIIVARWDN
jgi:hypothetical protein